MGFTDSEIRLLTRHMLVSDIVMIFAALFSVLGITWLLITKQILSPLKVMKTSFHRISEGDYSKKVTLKKKNELSLIATEFNIMVEQVKLRERKIRESEIKYRNLVESSSDIIFRTNIEGNLVFISQNFEVWTKYDIIDLMDQPFTNLFSSKFLIIAMKEFPDRLIGRDTILYELELLKYDGGIIPVELNISIQVDTDGQPVGATGIVRDITKRRETENELRNYEQMIASTTDYMWLIDKNLIIQAINDAYLKLARKRREKIIGLHVESILGKEVLRKNFMPYFEACMAGRNVKHQSWISMPGIKNRFMEISYYPNFDQDKTVSGVMINVRDITEQKNLESKLHQSQKMEALGTLAGGIAHDFNNIIGGIIGYAELIEMFDSSGNKNIKSRIQHVLKGANRAKELTKQILTFSHHSDQKKSPVKLGAIVREVMKFLRASIPSTIDITENIDCADCVVWANETSMHQVLMNLCTNAAHAMQKSGGTLSVSLSREYLGIENIPKISIENPGHFVKLSVSDTGEGIEPSIMERIFDPFFTTKAIGDGTGMGLAMVHGIIKNFNGAVTVNSKPSLGSTFNVYLPRFDSEIDEEEHHRNNLSSIPVGKGKILFIDDEEELVSFSREILEHLGYEVVGTTSSIDARQIFLSDPMQFDLVITDQTMPNITGFELAVEFMEKRKDLPVVLCTGFSILNLEEKAIASGIRHYLKKPIGARQLAEIVSRLTRTKGAEE